MYKYLKFTLIEMLKRSSHHLSFKQTNKMCVDTVNVCVYVCEIAMN